MVGTAGYRQENDAGRRAFLPPEGGVGNAADAILQSGRHRRILLHQESRPSIAVCVWAFRDWTNRELCLPRPVPDLGLQAGKRSQRLPCPPSLIWAIINLTDQRFSGIVLEWTAQRHFKKPLFTSPITTIAAAFLSICAGRMVKSAAHVAALRKWRIWRQRAFTSAMASMRKRSFL